MEKPTNYPIEPKHIWDQFFNITQIPRPSKHEEKIQAYLEKTACDNNLEYKKDDVGNIVIYVPATTGYESKDAIIIQNHMDMVTDATPDRKINFFEDPIVTFVEDGWLKADRTTLGADNGIGCAAALALIFEKELSHPALELLFTIDEETGLNGAWGVQKEFFKGKKMLNLDTEEWGSLYVGCAGGIDYDFEKDLELTDANPDKSVFKIEVEGFLGGHSGIDIHEQRANAAKCLVEALSVLSKYDIEIEEFRSGKAHNIIPRNAFAIIRTESKNISNIKEDLTNLHSGWKGYFPENDQSFNVAINEYESNKSKVVSKDAANLMVNFLNLFPHGAHSFDLGTGRSIVSMSNNMAIVLLVDDKFYVKTSLRFFDRNEVKTLEHKMESLGATFNVKCNKNGEYPSWKPKKNNLLLDHVKATYKDLFKEEAEVTAIHAGLECGILRDKIGDVDVVSFGPTIMGAHSPQERIEIETVENFWKLFTKVIQTL